MIQSQQSLLQQTHTYATPVLNLCGGLHCVLMRTPPGCSCRLQCSTPYSFVQVDSQCGLCLPPHYPFMRACADNVAYLRACCSRPA